jgi:hypothetical protein
MDCTNTNNFKIISLRNDKNNLKTGRFDMEMILSNHAQARFQQRGFDGECLDLISGLGKLEYAPGGAMRLIIPMKEAKRIANEIRNRSKRLIQMIEKSQKKGAIISSDDCTAITLYIKR